MPRFCSRADLERALGGAEILVQLLDKTSSNQPDLELMNQCLDAGSNEIASYIQLVIELDSLSAPYPMVLVTKSADAASFYAWRYGAYGQPIPEHIVQAHDKAISWAQDVGARKATIGSAAKPTLDPIAKMVDPDPDGMKVSVAGFKRGFR